MKFFLNLLSLSFLKEKARPMPTPPLVNAPEDEDNAQLLKDLRDREKEILRVQKNKQHDLFESLLNSPAKVQRLPQANAMLKNGYIPNNYSFIAILTKIQKLFSLPLSDEVDFYTSASTSEKETVKELITLSLNAMKKGFSEGVKYNFNISSSDHVSFSSIFNMSQLKELFKCAVEVPKLSDMSPGEKVVYLDKYKDHLISIEDNECFEAFLNQNKSFLELCELSLTTNLEEINNQLKIKNFIQHNSDKVDIILGANHLENSSLGKKCLALQGTISHIQNHYSTILEIEDKVFLNKILNEDVPKILSSSAVTPKEISDKYLELSQKSIASTLEEMVDGYQVIVDKLKDKYVEALTLSTDKALQGQMNYIEKKKLDFGVDSPAPISRTEKLPKKLHVGKH